MISEDNITIDGYTFFVQTYAFRSHIFIDAKDPLGDDGFIAALRKAQALLPYYQALQGVCSTGNLWDDYEPQPEQVSLVIKAYEENIIPVGADAYKIAIDLRDGAVALQPAKRPAPSRKTRPGYVYLIQGENGFYKIGRTVAPENRMKTFNVKLPFNVEYICLVKHDDHVSLETELHERFAAKRINGEWFALNDEDVTYIKALPTWFASQKGGE